MLTIALILSAFNIIFSVAQIYYSHRAGDFGIIVWSLITYFSILLPIKISENNFFLQGYSGYTVNYTSADYLNVASFVFLSNIFLALGYFIGRRLFPKKEPSLKISKKNVYAKLLIPLYLIILVVAIFFYWKLSKGMGYQEFVEFRGSNWGLVFLYASSPVILLLFLRGNAYSAIFLSLIYVYFAVFIGVRSFFLFSLFPIIFVYLMNREHRVNFSKNLLKKPVFPIVFFVIFAANGYIVYLKTGEIRLPEERLVDYMIQVIYELENGSPMTGLDSLERFLYSFLNPVWGFLNIEIQLNQDVQVYFASLIFGNIPDDKFFHYPSLWYADAYSSFGRFGIIFGLIWGLWFSAFESLIRINKIVLALFLPFFVWNIYMVFRGAIGNSIGPVIYPIYINLFIFGYAWMAVYSYAVRNGVSNKKLLDK